MITVLGIRRKKDCGEGSRSLRTIKMGGELDKRDESPVMGDRGSGDGNI
jgi:hypothetical protein